MTRKEKMELKRQIYAVVQDAAICSFTERKNATDMIKFHEAKDKIFNKAATNIVNLLEAAERPVR